MIDYSIKQAIIWDWNGTLLNDVALCVECMNQVLASRELPLLTPEKYREIFTFPVEAYYRLAGFDFNREPFKVPAIEFIKLYHQQLHRAVLFNEVLGVLDFIKARGLAQSVLSAMEHDSLVRSLSDKGIIGYFTEVSGINNHYAHSKLEIGEALVKKMNIRERRLLIVGDSLHDLEVSEVLGIDCLLIANGHQSKERLLLKTPNVVDNLSDLVDLFQPRRAILPS